MSQHNPEGEDGYIATKFPQMSAICNSLVVELSVAIAQARVRFSVAEFFILSILYLMHLLPYIFPYILPFIFRKGLRIKNINQSFRQLKTHLRRFWCDSLYDVKSIRILRSHSPRILCPFGCRSTSSQPAGSARGSMDECPLEICHVSVWDRKSSLLCGCERRWLSLD